nr:DNA polymerase Y family protein [Tianweitania sediminis]
MGKSWTIQRTGAAPLVVSRREDNAQRIAALDGTAEQRNIRLGMGIAEARAMHPDLEVTEEDPDADRRLLEALADWCDRYTPLVAVDRPDGLYLDITGCAHLFGGEAALMDDALRRLADQGFNVRAGLASTPGAAYALARFHSGAIVSAGDEADALAPFPLAALRLPPPVRQGLESVGLRRVGAVLAAPRAPLARRFGPRLLQRLDQAVGAVEEAITPRQPVPALSVERRFFEPIGGTEEIEQLVGTLSNTLQPALAQRGEGATALELALFRVDGEVFRLRVRSARPLRDPRLMQLLYREKLATVGETLDPGYGFDLVRLSVLFAQPYAEIQSDLIAEPGDEATTVALLVDRVEARLGHQVVVHPVLKASHIPERAVVHVPGVAEATMDPTEVGPPSLDAFSRPVRLLRRPEPVDVTAEVPEGPPAHFRWRRMHHRITRAEGPERLAPEWWHDPQARTRDYFRVEDRDGHRYWLFREGLYGGERSLFDLQKEDEAAPLEGDAPPPLQPRWYVHGIFA